MFVHIIGLGKLGQSIKYIQINKRRKRKNSRHLLQTENSK